MNEKLAELRERNGGLVEEIATALRQKLEEVGIKAEVKGREKKPYSIWSKMANKQIGLEQLSDIYAFRVVVDTIDDCYRVLGVSHTTCARSPAASRTTSRRPKQNNYHPSTRPSSAPAHQRVELQIRTRAMHTTAEYGVAAHALYKEAGKANGLPGKNPAIYNKESGPTSGFAVSSRRCSKAQPRGVSGAHQARTLQDQVFCFTPKGRLIALPRAMRRRSIRLCRAYDIGNAAIGAYVNGRHVPIDTRLRNGDEVEIQTSKSHTPPAAPGKSLVVNRPRTARPFARARDAVRRQYAELGRRSSRVHSNAWASLIPMMR